MIGNAIKHNYENGEIAIFLQDDTLLIQNTSHQAVGDKTDILFDRFYKNESTSTSLGLGLAIVREICELYHWKIHYEIVNQLHKITILFKEKP